MSDITNIDLDLSGATASRPLLPKQTRRVRIGEVRIETTDAGKKRLVMPLTLEEVAKDKAGNDVHPGFMVTHSFLLDESGGWTKARAAEELLRTKMAALGITEAEAKATPTDASLWLGREVNATFSTRERNGEEQQNVDRLSAIKA